MNQKNLSKNNSTETNAKLKEINKKISCLEAKIGWLRFVSTSYGPGRMTDLFIAMLAFTIEFYKIKHLICIFVFCFVVFCFYSNDSRAEKCWMIDCSGEIGYIYIPKFQYEKNLKNKFCRGYNSYQIFKEFGLPEVNSTTSFSKSSYNRFSLYSEIELIDAKYEGYLSSSKYHFCKNKYNKEIYCKGFEFYRKNYINHYKDLKQPYQIANCFESDFMLYLPDGYPGSSLVLDENNVIKILSYHKIYGGLYALVKILK